MIEREQVRTLEPVQAEPAAPPAQRWGSWLIIFLRIMAAISLIKGLYHWAVVCGIDAPSRAGFEAYATPYQAATVFFAVIDLVAAVGLWLAAPWGAVVWLTSIISMAAVEALFPQVFGGSLVIATLEMILLVVYLCLLYTSDAADEL